MSHYSIIAPSDYVDPLIDENYIIRKTVDSEVIRNTETVDTDFNPLKIRNISTELHSILQNDFYMPLMDTLTQELQQFYEKLYTFENACNIETYFGDQEEFISKASNLFSTLNINPPVEFLEYLNTNYYMVDFSEPTYETDILNIQNNWIRDVILTSYILKKWVGSSVAYEYIFKSMYRYGSASIRSKYTDVGAFTAFTNKYFKVTEFFGSEDLQIINSFSKLLPISQDTKWPLSINVRGIFDYFYLANVQYYRYDTNRTHDEGLGTEDILKYDTGVSFGAEDKGLILDITADKVMNHRNSINTEECLMDVPWLNYISSFSRVAKKVSDPIMIGTQISLVAQNTGQYIINPLVQQRDEDYFTHPNIKAKFQIFKKNWEENTNISYLKIGKGSYDDGSFNVFADHTQDPLLVDVPTDVKTPVFETAVGQYEINTFGEYVTVTCLVHKNNFRNESLINQLFLIAQSDKSNIDVPTTTITFPHKSITPGSCKFEIELLFTLEDLTEVKRTIVLQEIFDAEINEYIVSPFLLNEKGVKIQNEYFDTPVDFIVDSESITDIDYLPNARDNLITLLEIDTILGKPIFCKIDHVNGKLELKLKIDKLSKIGNIDPYKGINNIVLNGNINCSYTTNSIRSLNASAVRDISPVVGITEVALFNALGKMVAYGSFPPIIYDTEKYHVTFNCLLQKPNQIV